jgi:hypothetical protein
LAVRYSTFATVAVEFEQQAQPGQSRGSAFLFSALLQSVDLLYDMEDFV